RRRERRRRDDEDEEEAYDQRRAPLHPARWRRVRVGLQVVFVAACIWLLAFVLWKVAVLVGLFAGAEYGALEDALAPPAEQVHGHAPVLDLPTFIVGLMVGKDSLTAGLWLTRFSEIFMLCQGLVAIAGYAICLRVPARYGTRGLAIAALSL